MVRNKVERTAGVMRERCPLHEAWKQEQANKRVRVIYKALGIIALIALAQFLASNVQGVI